MLRKIPYNSFISEDLPFAKTLGLLLAWQQIFLIIRAADSWCLDRGQSMNSNRRSIESENKNITIIHFSMFNYQQASR